VNFAGFTIGKANAGVVAECSPLVPRVNHCNQVKLRAHAGVKDTYEMVQKMVSRKIDCKEFYYSFAACQ
jgi:hypothetical protein